MDRQSIIVLVLCFLLLMLWPQLVRKMYPPQPRPPASTNLVVETSTGAATNGAAASPVVVTTSRSSPAVLTTAVPVWTPSGEEQTLELTNADARFVFTSLGGGLKRVELLGYPETVKRGKSPAPTNNLAELNGQVSVPVLALLGDPTLVGDGVFTLSRTGRGVRVEKTLTNGLRVIKEFEPATNYLVRATVRLENTSAGPLALPAHEWVIGTATPMGPDDAGSKVGLMWYDGARKQEILGSWFDNASFFSCVGLTPRQPRLEYRAGQSNVVWAAVQNQFFTLAAMPREPAAQVVSRPVLLPVPASDEPSGSRRVPPPKGYQTALVYPAAMLPAGGALERELHFFAGPKEYRSLARIAMRFQNNVDLVMGFGGFFGFFSKALLLSMNWLHRALGLSYGWAIIAITVLIKALFWPLTQASTRSMKRMAALQPQMKALQEKYKDDPAKLNKKMMEFWKEHKVSPLGGCLPMLLQMPVFIGFFYMIQSAIELRGASFLWVADLSKPDTLFHIPGIGFPFNLLPLLMGATMLWQSHMTPPSPGMDPVQQKLMRYMPLMFLVFLYNFSAGLTLYWTVQNLLSILQMKLTRSTEPATGVAPGQSRVLPPKKRI